MSASQPSQDAPPKKTIKIGTRESALAIKQTQLVVEQLSKLHPDLQFAVHGMTTAGDKDKQTPLYNFGGKGLWTTELEAMLASREVDLVVHSLKDMPTTLPAGCSLSGITQREDPRDIVAFNQKLQAQHGWRTLADLPEGSVVGTSSVRRIAQLRRRYPGLRFADVRGNIDTRLRKVDAEDSQFAAIILAAAGLLRLNFGHRIAQYLDSDSAGVLHAVGQGALGIETREGDDETIGIVKGVEHRPTMLACTAERSVMRRLEGGCSVPIGVETTWLPDGKLRLRATVVHADGSEGVDAERSESIESADDAEAYGERVAQDLLDRGAGKILEALTQSRTAEKTDWVTAPAPTTASTS